jgi:DNA-binding MarR family transcriptional regulator
LSPSTVVGILDRLETKGLILRQRSTKDRRVVLVELTDAGRRLVSDAPSPLQDRLTEGLGMLPKAEQQEIAAALDKVVSLMEAREIDASPILETGPILQGPDPPSGKEK